MKKKRVEELFMKFVYFAISRVQFFNFLTNHPI